MIVILETKRLGSDYLYYMGIFDIQGDAPPPKKKTRPIYFWLKYINLILAFSFFYNFCVKHPRFLKLLGIIIHRQKFECTELELFCFIFVEGIKKFMSFVFLVGSPSITVRKKKNLENCTKNVNIIVEFTQLPHQ